MENVMPRVSIIIICWNNQEFLNDCFGSLRKQSYRNLEIILADNGSNDNSIIWTSQQFPEVRIIENHVNLGFAEGNNSAANIVIEENLSKYIFILNPDTVVDEKCLEILVEEAESNSSIGCFVPKMRVLNRPKKISAAGGDCILRCGDNLSRGFYFDDEGQFDEKRLVFGPSGAAAFYRVDMIEEIGLYDKHLFTYYEDVDMNFRIQLSGWKALYTPSALVYHYHSGTLDDFSTQKTYLLNRNKFYTIFKNYPKCLFKHYYIPIIRSFGAFSLYCFKNKLVFIWLKIILFQFKSIPSIINNRIKIQKILKRRTKKEVSESVDLIFSLIEEHENLMSSETRIKCVNEYLEDLKSRKI